MMYTCILNLGVDVDLLAIVAATYLGEGKLWSKTWESGVDQLHLTQKVNYMRYKLNSL